MQEENHHRAVQPDPVPPPQQQGMVLLDTEDETEILPVGVVVVGSTTIAEEAPCLTTEEIEGPLTMKRKKNSRLILKRERRKILTWRLVTYRNHPSKPRSYLKRTRIYRRIHINRRRLRIDLCAGPWY